MTHNGPDKTDLATADTGQSLAVVEQKLGYKFQDPAFLERALTHSSAVSQRNQSNERFEFLGDRVLGLVREEVAGREPVVEIRVLLSGLALEPPVGPDRLIRIEQRPVAPARKKKPAMFAVDAAIDPKREGVVEQAVAAHTPVYLRINTPVTRNAARLTSGLPGSALTVRGSHPLDD